MWRGPVPVCVLRGGVDVRMLRAEVDVCVVCVKDKGWGGCMCLPFSGALG